MRLTFLTFFAALALYGQQVDSNIRTWNGYTIGNALESSTVRYVSATGSDSNSGATWLLAKATVAAAIGALPNLTSPTIHYGTVYVGPGTFTESATPIEFNANIHLVCASPGEFGSRQGSVIKLANGRNTSLFSYTAAFATAGEYAHYLDVENCTFDGNAANNASTPSTEHLVQIYNGGFSNVFKNVLFVNAKNYALYVNNKAVNFRCDTCSFGTNGGAFLMNDVEGGCVVTFIDSQIDNSGDDPIYIKQDDADTSSTNQFTFINTKSEAFVAGHVHLIRFKPRVSANGNPVHISVIGVSAVNTVGSGAAVLYEENQLGHAAAWTISGVTSVNYPLAFSSAKTSVTSASGRIKYMTTDDPANTYAYSPELEMMSNAKLWVGSGDPEGNVTAGVGSLYLRTSGGSLTTLYVKESGTGNTGWIGK